MEDLANTTRIPSAEPPFPLHKSSHSFLSSKVGVRYTIRAGDEAILSILDEERARKQRDRYEESKEETKEEDYDDGLCNRFRTAFSRERIEESKEETKQDVDDDRRNRFPTGFSRDRFEESKEETNEDFDDGVRNRFRTAFSMDSFEESKEETNEDVDNDLRRNRYRTAFSRDSFEESKEEAKEQNDDDEQHNGFQPCLDYYEEELDLDPRVLVSGLSNFRIVTHEEFTPPEITWIIKAMYNSWHDLQFKLMTPKGAYMLLYACEIIKCVLILVDYDGRSAYFQIEDLHGNILFADCDQVEAHILYIISMETRKRQATIDRDISVQDAKPKRRRKYSALASGVRKLSDMMKQRRKSSQSS